MACFLILFIPLLSLKLWKHFQSFKLIFSTYAELMSFKVDAVLWLWSGISLLESAGVIEAYKWLIFFILQMAHILHIHIWKYSIVMKAYKIILLLFFLMKHIWCSIKTLKVIFKLSCPFSLWEYVYDIWQHPAANWWIILWLWLCSRLMVLAVGGI